jgi:hypothetical protein
MRKTVASRQPRLAKYIVLIWNGREQVLVFPFGLKHANMLEYIQTENPHVKAVSAGFYCNERVTLWIGGQSNSLNLKSRPKDRQLLQSFFNSPSRRLWDLTILAKEAGVVTRHRRANGRPAGRR